MISNFDFPEKLRRRLAEPLPGREAQYRMANLRRFVNPKAYETPPDSHKTACVLVLVFPRGEAWHTVLIERTAHPNDRHSGQVSFPGGKWDESDASLWEVAIREAEEEVGVPRRAVQMLGRLTELYIPVSNFLVHPFVGWVSEEPEFLPQLGEVAAIFTPPVGLFLDVAARKTTDIQLSNGLLLTEVPSFEVENRVVWGATAMILSEFSEVSLTSMSGE